jgi:cyclic pyranopterin phosphate synthase
LEEFTHFDSKGNARMVDVGEKDITERMATAKVSIMMQPETLALIRDGGVKKGDVLTVAQLGGIMGAKRTPDLIPLCHPLALTSVAIELTCNSESNSVDVTASCRVKGRTGVEMEALTAAAVTSLTIYDMCKAVDRRMCITNLRVVHKSGGRSGTFEAE